jgi:hypothetical protein
MNDMRSRLGGLGVLLLALYLLLVGLMALVGLAIPEWVAGLTAVVAGLFLLVGR